MSLSDLFYVLVVVLSTTAICLMILKSPRQRTTLSQDILGGVVALAILVMTTVSVVRTWLRGEPSEMFATGLGYVSCVAIIATVSYRSFRDRAAWKRFKG